MNVDRGAAFLDAQRERAKRRMSPVVMLSEAQLPPSQEWFVKGLLQRRDLALVYGPSGCGKTFLIADLLARIAAGSSWRGRRTAGALAVYVAAEAGASSVKRFIAVRENVLGEAREQGVLLAILTRGANLLDALDVDALLEQLQQLSRDLGAPICVVCFDTLSRSMPGGDENGEGMTALIGVADRIRHELGAAVIFVHHSGKDPSRGARGHGSLYAAADLVVAVSEGAAVVEKLRDGVSGERFAFRLEPVVLGEDSDGDPITTCIIVHQEDEAPSRRRAEPILSGVAKVGLQALREAIADHGEPLPETSTIPRGACGVTLEQWRERFRLRYGVEADSGKRDADAVRKALQRSREALLKAGAIGISSPYVWLA